jgi:hypothetical protein
MTALAAADCLKNARRFKFFFGILWFSLFSKQKSVVNRVKRNLAFVDFGASPLTYQALKLQ